MTNQIVRKGGKPCEEPAPGKAEAFLLRGINLLKQAMTLPVVEPTEAQRLLWAEELRLQAIKNKQAEFQQYAVNNEVYEQALRDTPEHIRALNVDFDAQVEALNPSDSTPAPVLETVRQISDEPGIIEYTKNKAENLVLNQISAELLQAGRDKIRNHSQQQRAKQQEAAKKKENDKPKPRREKR